MSKVNISIFYKMVACLRIEDKGTTPSNTYIIVLHLVFSQVPKDTMVRSRFSYIQQGDPVPLSELGRSKANPDDDYRSYIETCIAGLLKVKRSSIHIARSLQLGRTGDREGINGSFNPLVKNSRFWVTCARLP